MALLAGIDEAGYGPHLGPLVVAVAAMEFDTDAAPDPDLWPALETHVAPRPAAGETRVVVCDSKVAHGRTDGPALLERAVLGFLAAAGVRPRTLAALLRAVDAAEDGRAPPPPWHRPEALVLPAMATAESVDEASRQLEEGLAATGGRAAVLSVRVARADRFNRLVGEGARNKASALFGLAAELIGEMRRRQGNGPAHLTMDRHGGRRYYGRLLAGAFPMADVRVEAEAAEESRYVLSGPGPGAGPMHITIRERCEAWSLATALASMAAKYIRELHMLQLNAWFGERVPGLRRTAGYGRDAWRFLSEVAAAREAVGVPESTMLRCR